MSNEVTIDLLQERVDDLTVANETLRERVHDAAQELIRITEQYQQLELRNRELSAHIDRLRLHLSQGIEL